MQFTATRGLRLTERTLVIEDQPVNLWALHRTVFLRLWNSFKSKVKERAMRPVRPVRSDAGDELA